MPKGITFLLGTELLAILQALGHDCEIAVVDASSPADAHASGASAAISSCAGA